MNEIYVTNAGTFIFHSIASRSRGKILALSDSVINVRNQQRNVRQVRPFARLVARAFELLIGYNKSVDCKHL